MYSELFSRIYDEFGWNYYPEAFARKLPEWMEKNARSVRRVLDLGCGTGVLCRILRQEGYETCGVDLSEAMIEIARKEDPHGRYEVADMAAYIPDGPYDLVTCTGDALNHLTDPGDIRKMFAHVHDCLTPDGCFLFDLLSEYEIADGEPIDFDYSDTVNATFRMRRDGQDMVTLTVTVTENGRTALEETITEKIYDTGMICGLLQEAGFGKVTCSHSLTGDEKENAMTWYVTAGK